MLNRFLPQSIGRRNIVWLKTTVATVPFSGSGPAARKRDDIVFSFIEKFGRRPPQGVAVSDSGAGRDVGNIRIVFSHTKQKPAD